MSRVGGRHETALYLAQKRFLSHDPQDPLVVHHPSSPIELLGDPAIAITRELQNDPLNGVPQLDVPLGFLFGGRALVVPGATHTKQTAQLTLGDGRLVRLFGLRDHGVPPLERYFPSPFFRISFSGRACRRSAPAPRSLPPEPPRGRRAVSRWRPLRLSSRTPCAISRVRSLRDCARGRAVRGASGRLRPAGSTEV